MRSVSGPFGPFQSIIGPFCWFLPVSLCKTHCYRVKFVQPSKEWVVMVCCTVPPFYLDNKWILGGCYSSDWGSLLRWEAFCLFDTLQKPVKKIPPSTFSIIWSEYGQKWYTLPLHVFISITYGHRTIAHAHFMHQALLPVSHSFFSLYICSPGNCESVLGSEVTDSVQQ